MIPKSILAKKMSRRDFFRTVGRICVFGGVGLLGVRLVGGRSLRELCINSGICRSCTIIPNCGLPPALSFREQQKRG